MVLPRLSTSLVAGFLWLTASATWNPGIALGDEPWVWPTSGAESPAPTVTRGFSPPEQAWAAGHRGVDLLTLARAPIYAAGSGTVRYAGLVAGRGVVVLAHDDGTRTTYEPVGAIVSAGTRVRAGEKIGVLATGVSHCSPRSCLHWARLRGQTYLDPLALLGLARKARLLPVWTVAGAHQGVSAPSRDSAIETSSLEPDKASARRWQLASSSEGALLLLGCAALLTWLVVSRRQRARPPPSAGLVDR